MTSLRRPPTFMPGDALVPARDDLAGAERERERLAAVPRRVELRAVGVVHADVLHGDVVALLRRLALALDDVLGLELGRRLAAGLRDRRLLVEVLADLVGELLAGAACRPRSRSSAGRSRRGRRRCPRRRRRTRRATSARAASRAISRSRGLSMGPQASRARRGRRRRSVLAHARAGARFTAGGVGASSASIAGPAAEPVVCLHGVPTSSFLYRKVLAELGAHGLRGVAFDLPGLGLADRPARLRLLVDRAWAAGARRPGRPRPRARPPRRPRHRRAGRLRARRGGARAHPLAHGAQHARRASTVHAARGRWSRSRGAASASSGCAAHDAPALPHAHAPHRHRWTRRRSPTPSSTRTSRCCAAATAAARS